MMRPATTDSPRILWIGRPDPAFTSVFQWLRSAVPEDHLTSAPSISLALNSHFSSATLPDLVLVFREFPDQFATVDIQRLIGAMLFRRVVCCDGPLCLADGRTHGHWPAICRVPSNSAIAVLRQEFHALRLAKTPVSPMAASEDVFAYRLSAFPTRTHNRRPHLRAFIAICDPDLRHTVRSILTLQGVQAESAHPDVLNALAEADSLLPDWLLVDLDEAPTSLISKLPSFHTSGLPVTALTGFPGQSQPVWATALVDKTELFLQLGSLHQDLTQ